MSDPTLSGFGSTSRSVVRMNTKAARRVKSSFTFVGRGLLLSVAAVASTDQSRRL